MSASERLRALDRTATMGPWALRDDGSEGVHIESGTIETLADFGADPGATPDVALAVALRNALPLIADVVEAAERFALGVSEDHENARTYAIDDALTALREHLEGGDE